MWIRQKPGFNEAVMRESSTPCWGSRDPGYRSHAPPSAISDPVWTYHQHQADKKPRIIAGPGLLCGLFPGYLVMTSMTASPSMPTSETQQPASYDPDHSYDVDDHLNDRLHQLSSTLWKQSVDTLALMYKASLGLPVW